MNREELLAWRRTRLAQLADEMGGNPALGRAIGHSSGEQLSGMVAGRRALTEKTMDAIEALPGRSNWFQRGAAVVVSEQEPTILELLRYQRSFIARLDPADRKIASIALRHFIDHPEELNEVAESLKNLAERSN